MEKLIDKELLEICKKISNKNKSDDEWALIESDDMFQSKYYEGGYDATEEAFCFSYYSHDGKEYWFQLTLEEVYEIIGGSITNISLREAAI